MYDIIFVRNKDRISGERPAAVTTADSMTSLSESLQEVGRSIILQTRSPTKIGTWNVRTMFEAGRSAEMKEAGLDWHSMVRMSRDRKKWKELVGGLCSARNEQA